MKKKLHVEKAAKRNQNCSNIMKLNSHGVAKNQLTEHNGVERFTLQVAKALECYARKFYILIVINIACSKESAF